MGVEQVKAVVTTWVQDYTLNPNSAKKVLRGLGLPKDHLKRAEQNIGAMSFVHGAFELVLSPGGNHDRRDAAAADRT